MSLRLTGHVAQACVARVRGPRWREHRSDSRVAAAAQGAVGRAGDRPWPRPRSRRFRRHAAIEQELGRGGGAYAAGGKSARAEQATRALAAGLVAAIGRGVSARAIGMYECDEAMPGSGVLITLADALHSPVDYPLDDRDLVLDDLEFRENAFTSKRAEARVEAGVLAALKR